MGWVVGGRVVVGAGGWGGGGVEEPASPGWLRERL